MSIPDYRTFFRCCAAFLLAGVLAAGHAAAQQEGAPAAVPEQVQEPDPEQPQAEPDHSEMDTVIMALCHEITILKKNEEKRMAIREALVKEADATYNYFDTRVYEMSAVLYALDDQKIFTLAFYCKAATSLGLIERGAALVADDMVYVRNVGGELVASAPEMSRGFMEVRGLGIVNITTLFGLKSIRHNKRLDLIVTLIPAKDQEALDRLGLEREGLDVLGEKVLHVQLSVAPGRDIARLVEVAAMDYHLKDMGIDMAGEFNRRLMSNFQPPENQD